MRINIYVYVYGGTYNACCPTVNIAFGGKHYIKHPEEDRRIFSGCKGLRKVA